jgi:hypothetical protein
MASRNRKASRNVAPAVINESAPATPAVAQSAPEAPETQGESNVEQEQTAAAAPTLVLKNQSKNGKRGAYGILGQMGVIRVPKILVTNETFPHLFSDLVFKTPDAAKQAKLAAKAERQGTRAQSATERAAKLEARIAKAADAAEKNRAKLAKLRAKMPVTAQEQTEAAVAGVAVQESEEVTA